MIAVIVAIVVVLASALSYWALRYSHSGHGSISIDGNDDFDRAHGVRHGTGSAEDPFVIQNVTITKGKGLSISNTDAYAVIRNVTLETLEESGSGVIVRYSKNILFEHLTITNSSTGLYVENAENCTFVKCNIDIVRSGQSVSFYASGNCTLSKSRISNSTHSNVAGSVVLGNSIGCRIIDNEIVDCEQGIFVTASESCVVIGNTIRSGYHAILVDSSFNMTISLNDLGTSTFGLQGTELTHYSKHTITEDNSVNGLPLLYIDGASDIGVQNVPIGQLIAVNCCDFYVRNLTFDKGTHECIGLVHCNRVIVDNIHISGGTRDWYTPYYTGVATYLCENVTVTSCTISNVSSGVKLSGSNSQASWNIVTDSEDGISCNGLNVSVSNNTLLRNRHGINVVGGDANSIRILNNSISGGEVGVMLDHVSNTTVELNRIQDNNWGVLLYQYYSHAGDILVFHNDFIQNFYQASVQWGCNVSAVWDAGYPAGGNYWSDYSGIDHAQGVDQTSPGPDGIGDSPYHVLTGSLLDKNVDFWDEYPLMNPCTA